MARISTEISLKGIIPIIQSMQIPRQLSNVQNGWLSISEARALYGLSYLIDGPFLEIGAWAGLSTTVIGGAIRDSGYDKRFVTAELNPTLKNFKPQPGGMGFFHPPDSEICLGVVGMSSFNSEMRPVMERPGGVIGLLQENLAVAGLSELVQIHLGEFQSAPALKYNFIFSDVAHNTNEIDAHIPKIKNIVNGRKVIVAFHDTSDQNRVHICNNIEIIDGWQVDSLFVCETNGQSV